MCVDRPVFRYTDTVAVFLQTETEMGLNGRTRGPALTDETMTDVARRCGFYIGESNARRVKKALTMSKDKILIHSVPGADPRGRVRAICSAAETECEPAGVSVRL